MPLGHAEIIRSDYAKAVQAKIAKAKRAYEAARNIAEQSMQANAPEDTGALKRSSTAKLIESGLGFIMRSFGNEETGQAYAKHVNGGHHITKKDGTIIFVAAVPYFSQAEADARAEFFSRLRASR